MAPGTCWVSRTGPSWAKTRLKPHPNTKVSATCHQARGTTDDSGRSARLHSTNNPVDANPVKQSKHAACFTTSSGWSTWHGLDLSHQQCHAICYVIQRCKCHVIDARSECHIKSREVKCHVIPAPRAIMVPHHTPREPIESCHLSYDAIETSYSCTRTTNYIVSRQRWSSMPPSPLLDA